MAIRHATTALGLSRKLNGGDWDQDHLIEIAEGRTLVGGSDGFAVEVQARSSLEMFGAIADGASHPLSEQFATVALAQVKYPHATALTQEIDWAAAQAALNLSASIGGMRIHFNGTLNIGASPLVPTGKFIFEGEGRNASRIIYTGNGNAFTISNFSDGWCIKDLNFLHTGTAPTAGAAIAINAASNGCVADCGFNFAFNCITIQNSQNNNLNGNILWEFDNYGIALLGGNVSTYINHCFINGGTGLANPNDAGLTSIGVYMLDKCDGTYIHQTDIILCNVGVKSDATGGHAPGYSVIEGSFIDSNTTSVALVWAKLVKFTTCWISSRTGNGVELTECDSISFVNTTFVWCGEHGLFIASSTKRTLVQGCSVSGCSTKVINTYNGIEMAPGCTDVQILGCTIGNNALLPPGFNGGSQLYGIKINAGCERYVISDNNLLNNATGPLFGHTQSTASKIVKNNIGLVTEDNGTALIPAGSTTVTVTHGLIGTPTWVLATPNGDTGGRWWIQNRVAGTFQIALAAAHVDPVSFNWRAFV